MPEPQTPPTAYAATAGGYRVPLRLYGASAQAPSLLVLPAMGLAAGFYAPLASALANAGINTVLFEQRGYGLSAVRAARRAFENGPWRRMPPGERKKVLIKLADLLMTHREELALLDSLNMGKPVMDAYNVDVPGAT